MYKLLIVLVLLGPISDPSLHGQSVPQTPAFKTFDLASDPTFRDYKQVVTEFAVLHRPEARNDFCVFGYIAPDNLKSAWLIWRQGRQIILWEGQKLDSSRRKINLSSDVAPTEADLHGSTYRVTKAWVKQVTTTCAHSGVNVRVPKSKISH
jgi:hypothetical protein